MSRRGRILAFIVAGVLLLLAAVKIHLNAQRQTDHVAWLVALMTRSNRLTAIDAELATDWPRASRDWPVIARQTMPRDGGGTIEIDVVRTPMGDITVSMDRKHIVVLSRSFPPPPAEFVSPAWEFANWADLFVGVCAILAWAVALVHAVLERSVQWKGAKLSLIAAILLLAAVLLWTNDLSYWQREKWMIASLPFAMLAGTGSFMVWISLRRGFAAGRCGACGYDLTGNISGVCPECGRTVGHADY
jgi:hypothetical protein